VFVVAHGGTDLEHFDLQNAAEARSLLLQVALTLAVAEEACEFEHRDLHWGNLLLRRRAMGEGAGDGRETKKEPACDLHHHHQAENRDDVSMMSGMDVSDARDDASDSSGEMSVLTTPPPPPPSRKRETGTERETIASPRSSSVSCSPHAGAAMARFRLRGVEIEMVQPADLQVCLIDFTLSRLTTEEGGVAFSDLETDPELFLGPKGNCQADTYRRMRKVTRDRWAGFYPSTNSLWMHYLADTVAALLEHRLAPSDRHALRGFRRRALQYQSCGELIWDEFFDGQWRHVEGA
jgi:hypothetical protein